ncbi:MAG: sel1 repeat family protein, partial [Thiogranum sp.]
MSETSNDDVDFASGMAAFEARHFSRAAQLLSPFANEGNAEAQHRLAIMYQNGLGV